MGRKWYMRSSATCWVVTNGSVVITFPSEKLAKEYVDFKNGQRTARPNNPLAAVLDAEMPGWTNPLYRQPDD